MAASLRSVVRPPMALDSTVPGERTSPTGARPSTAFGQAGPPLGAAHRVDLRRALGQGTRGPALPRVLAAEHLASAGGAVHASGLARIEGQGEHRGPRLHAHDHPRPARTAVLAAEQRADLALEVRAAGDPDGARVAGRLADVAAIGLPVGIEGLEPRAGPVL